MQERDASFKYHASDLKFQWYRSYGDGYVLDLFKGVMTVHVQKFNTMVAHTSENRKYFNRWEIVVGEMYWSRDKKQFFNDYHEAMIVAEQLLGKIFTKGLERLNA